MKTQEPYKIQEIHPGYTLLIFAAIVLGAFLLQPVWNALVHVPFATDAFVERCVEHFRHH
jgi:hypothetical protein